MKVPENDIRLQLRLARFEPVLGAPSDTARRRTFGAAMQQFEDLLQSASGLSYLSRPLPLFYALSQAGRAITAARSLPPYELQAHGLSFHQVNPPADLADRVIRVTPRRDWSDSFSMVARTLGVRAINADGIRFDLACAALPELSSFTHMPSRRAIPLDYKRQGMPGVHFVMSTDAKALVGFWPDTDQPSFSDNPDQAAARHLAAYPTAAGWQLEGPPPQLDEQGYVVARIKWTTEHGSSEDDRARRIEFVAPMYRGRRYLVPELGNIGVIPTIMRWWLVLFALSMLARYEPAEWSALMDVDKSEWAAPLEYALDEALVALPPLVLSAIAGRRIELV